MTVQIGTNFDEKYVEFPPHQPKGSLQQDVFLVKNFIVNAIGEQVRTPAEICSGMHYRLALPLPWAAR